MSISGVVYAIVNIVNGKLYIGSTVDFEKRKSAHKRQLRSGTHHSKHLQRAYNKYGESVFEFRILEYVDRRDQLLEREQFHIDSHKSYLRSKGYNVSRKATNCVLYGEEHWTFGVPSDQHPLYGRRHTEETKKKISDALSGERHPCYGKPSPLRGKPLPESTKKKISEAVKGRTSYWKGKQLPEEVREKISRATKGRAVSEKVIHKSPEWCRNISRGKKGKLLGGDNPNARGVIQLSPSLKMIRRYDSIADAVRATGVNINGIIGCCRGRRKTAGGFVWRYEDDIE